MPSVLKFALILLLAAGLAIAARAMYVASIDRQTSSAPAPDVQVRVAAADLPAGLLLRDSDLAWKSVSRSSAPETAFVEGSTRSVVAGALLRHDIKADKILHTGDLILPDAPGFLAAALKPGKRAVSVPINDVSGNAGLIQPGDYVDMILTQHMGKGGDLGPGQQRVVSETVVRNARIIAVGSSFQRDAEPGKAGPSRARTVTIEVDPRTAEAVTVAAQLGSLSMALRSFATTDRDAEHDKASAGASVVAWEADAAQSRQSGPVWGSDVSRVLELKPADTEVKPKAEIPRHIVIMRGQDKQEQELATHAQ